MPVIEVQRDSATRSVVERKAKFSTESGRREKLGEVPLEEQVAELVSVHGASSVFVDGVSVADTMKAAEESAPAPAAAKKSKKGGAA